MSVDLHLLAPFWASSHVFFCSVFVIRLFIIHGVSRFKLFVVLANAQVLCWGILDLLPSISPRLPEPSTCMLTDATCESSVSVLFCASSAILSVVSTLRWDPSSLSAFCWEEGGTCWSAPFSSSSTPALLASSHCTSLDSLLCRGCSFVSSIAGLVCIGVSSVGAATANTIAYEGGRVCIRALFSPCRLGQFWNMCPLFSQP